MEEHEVVSREEWLATRKEHLVREKEFTRLRDRLSRERRGLPWVKVDDECVFDRNEKAEVFHTYSCYGRRLDMLNRGYHYMDLAPKGRDEDDLLYSMAWVRRRDQYGD